MTDTASSTDAADPAVDPPTAAVTSQPAGTKPGLLGVLIALVGLALIAAGIVGTAVVAWPLVFLIPIGGIVFILAWPGQYLVQPNEAPGADPVRPLQGHRRPSRLASDQPVHPHGVAQDLAARAQLHHQRVEGQRRRGQPHRDLRGGGVAGGRHRRGRVRGGRLRGLRARPERDRHPPSGHPVPLRRLRGRPGVAALGPRHGGSHAARRGAGPPRPGRREGDRDPAEPSGLRHRDRRGDAAPPAGRRGGGGQAHHRGGRGRHGRGALELLAERSVVQLDEQAKASMVANLLVVLTSEQQTTPVVNTGALP